MNYPKIRIKNSFLLNGQVIPLLQPELNQTGREEEAHDDVINQKVRDYTDAWREYEQRIIPAMCKVLDIEFNQNIIDVYVAPFRNSFSDPMVISTKYPADRAVDVLTHELTHRLLTDNNKLPMKDGRKLSEHWKELFGEHPFKVQTHIPVHAMLEYIFTDILNEPLRLERDIAFCSNFEPYAKAWEYVKETGYMAILERLRVSYDKS